MKITLSKTTKEVLMIAAAVVIVLGIGVALWYAVKEHARWEAWCEGQGGRVVEDTDTNIGIGQDGQMVTTTDTTYYCLNQDGGILDIR